MMGERGKEATMLRHFGDEAIVRLASELPQLIPERRLAAVTRKTKYRVGARTWAVLTPQLDRHWGSVGGNVDRKGDLLVVAGAPATVTGCGARAAHSPCPRLPRRPLCRPPAPARPPARRPPSGGRPSLLRSGSARPPASPSSSPSPSKVHGSDLPSTSSPPSP